MAREIAAGAKSTAAKYKFQLYRSLLFPAAAPTLRQDYCSGPDRLAAKRRPA
jgi:hypothetical protein